MYPKKVITHIQHLNKRTAIKLGLWAILLCNFYGLTSAQNKNIEFCVGEITDSQFFSKVDSMINYNKFHKDPIFYLHIHKKTETQYGGTILCDIESNKSLTDTIYIYVSPEKTVDDKLFIDYVMVNYSTRIYALPRSAENALYRIVGKKQFRHNHKVWMDDLDNFFRKRNNIQLLRYINGKISEVDKNADVYRAAME